MRQHWLTLLSGLVESLLVTGMAFGWASLVFVLKVDGYFAGYCDNATREEDFTVYTGIMLPGHQIKNNIF